jgi:hypothetical protein
MRMQIPRCARNDSVWNFFNKLLGVETPNWGRVSARLSDHRRRDANDAKAPVPRRDSFASRLGTAKAVP